MKGITIVVLFAVLAVTYAADCTIKGRELKLNEKLSPPGECIRYTCEAPGKIRTETCQEAKPLENQKSCKLSPQDLTKAWPECCPAFKC